MSKPYIKSWLRWGGQPNEPPRRMARAAGLTPIGQFDDADVFICGYPKSGNTWFQYLITGVVFGCDARYTPDPLIQTIVPDVSDRKFYLRYQTPCYFKTHLLPQPQYKRIVYLLRDGRDVMVSYYHHQRAMMGEKVDFLEMVCRGRSLFPCKWHEHVEAYLSHQPQTQMLTVRYEDLIADTLGQLRRVCDFIGIDRSESMLQSAREQASFQAMRDKEQTPLWVKRPKWKDANEFFVRRGVVGSYKDEMSPEVLEALLDAAGPTLKKCGYL